MRYWNQHLRSCQTHAHDFVFPFLPLPVLFPPVALISAVASAAGFFAADDADASAVLSGLLPPAHRLPLPLAQVPAYFPSRCRCPVVLGELEGVWPACLLFPLLHQRQCQKTNILTLIFACFSARLLQLNHTHAHHLKRCARAQMLP